MVMPSMPFPESGAEQMDRADGIRQLVRLGFDVFILAKVTQNFNEDIVRANLDSIGVSFDTVPYKFVNSLSFSGRIRRFYRKLLDPVFFDGAAQEYDDNPLKDKLKKILLEWKPNLVWFEYTYLWPLYSIVKEHGVPIVTRSANFEPTHFLDEDGRGIINYLKYFAKLFSEKRMLKNSDAVFSITPQEESIYRSMGHKNVHNLPLRSLHHYISKDIGIQFSNKEKLNVFFMGSTYNVSHNREALKFILFSIVPRINTSYPNKFDFFIFGKKIPPDLANSCVGNVKYMGYVDNLTEELSKMDIACIPSLFGSGMQQKIFEPLTLGIPTLTSPRGIAQYPYIDKESVLLASSEQVFVDKFGLLLDESIRSQISERARQVSIGLFESNVIDAIVYNVISKLV